MNKTEFNELGASQSGVDLEKFSSAGTFKASSAGVTFTNM